MWPAIAWDDVRWGGNATRGWSVLGRLRQRQEDAARGRRPRSPGGGGRNDGRLYDMIPAPESGAARSRIRASDPGFHVLAFLFAMPGEPAIDTLDERGSYFDLRTGENWDLFFPGYYRSDQPGLEAHEGSESVGSNYARDWYFNARYFDDMRRQIERDTNESWAFSGGSDLVLINVHIPDQGPPTIDWESAQAWTLDPSLKLAQNVSAIIERVSRDLESGAEDPHYGLGNPRSAHPGPDEGTTKKILIGALSGIAASVTTRWMGL